MTKNIGRKGLRVMYKKEYSVELPKYCSGCGGDMEITSGKKVHRFDNKTSKPYAYQYRMRCSARPKGIMKIIKSFEYHDNLLIIDSVNSSFYDKEVKHRTVLKRGW